MCIYQYGLLTAEMRRAHTIMVAGIGALGGLYYVFRRRKKRQFGGMDCKLAIFHACKYMMDRLSFSQTSFTVSSAALVSYSARVIAGKLGLASEAACTAVVYKDE